MHLKAVSELSVIHVTKIWFKCDSWTKPFCVTWFFVIRLNFKSILFSAMFLNLLFRWQANCYRVNLPYNIRVIRIITHTLPFDWDLKQKELPLGRKQVSPEYILRWFFVKQKILKFFGKRANKIQGSTMQPLKTLKLFELTWPLRKRPSNSWMLLVFCKKNLRILNFQKPLWWDNLLPTATIRVVAL